MDGLINTCINNKYNSVRGVDYAFMKDATQAANVSYYDYIIVGGGTAGCPLAATLSERFRVLLLERGGSPYGDERVEDMTRFTDTLADTSPGSPRPAVRVRGRRHQLAAAGAGRRQLHQRRVLHARRRRVRQGRRVGPQGGAGGVPVGGGRRGVPAGAGPVAGAPDEGRAEDVAAEGLAAGGATDEGRGVGLRDDVKKVRRKSRRGRENMASLAWRHRLYVHVRTTRKPASGDPGLRGGRRRQAC